MKSNIITAVIILTGCLCAWGYLAAQSDGEKTTSSAITPATGSLLEIKEPSQEDFEHCAKRAVDFMASWSDNQTQTDLAMQVLFGDAIPLELSTPLAHLSEIIVRMKSETTIGRPELIAKKSLGENIVILHYNYLTDKEQVVCRFYFGRILDQSGTPLQWRCVNFAFTADVEEIAILCY